MGVRWSPQRLGRLNTGERTSGVCLYIVGYGVYKFEIISPQCLHNQRFFTFAWDAVCRSRKTLLKCRSSSSTLCFSSPSSVNRYPRSASFSGQKDGNRKVLNREDEAEHSTLLSHLPPLCAYWCAVWRCHSGGGLAWFIIIFGRTLRIRFDLFNVWTYRSELNVTPPF